MILTSLVEEEETKRLTTVVSSSLEQTNPLSGSLSVVPNRKINCVYYGSHIIRLSSLSALGFKLH